MEVHSFYCDVCNQEFAESQLMTLKLPVWTTGDADADYYNDERLRRPRVRVKAVDICDDCLIEATHLQEVTTRDGVEFIKVSPCPEAAEVTIEKHSSETTTRHGKVVKKRCRE